MDLDMEEVTERFDKATGKLKGLESNHNMIKKKLSLMASIITGQKTIKRLLKSNFYDFKGLIVTWKHQTNC